MPLVRITIARGMSDEGQRAVADGVHRALVETANVPADDRFQVIEEVPAERLVWSPRYLGIERRGPVVFVQVFLNLGRSLEVKKALYARIADHLAADPGIRREDVLVNLVEVPKENWSFGAGLMSYEPAPPPMGITT
jgi:phenylpyruvate tautomerase PptA (4-oxalocrotonate tautomerase family)